MSEELDKSHVFDYILGHQHCTFSCIAPNLAVNVDKTKLCSTINKYKQEFQRKAKFYHHNLYNFLFATESNIKTLQIITYYIINNNSMMCSNSKG